MACPTCDCTMQGLGGGGDQVNFWCPRCGTLLTKSVIDNQRQYEAPKLVERCREFEKHLFFKSRNMASIAEWGRLGVCGSIHKPEDRTT